MVVTFGEIMLRLSTPGNQRFAQAGAFEVCYGGGEANVAASLAAFGVTASFVTRLPQNDLGEACLAFLRKHGVDVSHVVRGGERLGIYFLETGSSARGSKVVYDRAGSGLATIRPGMIRWEEVFRGADWFHWTGITPAVSEGATQALAEAIAAARAANLTVSCDLNYRGKLWKWGKTAGQVMSELVSGSDIAIANEEDAEKVFGIRPVPSPLGPPKGTFEEAGDALGRKLSAADYLPVGRELAKRFPRLRRIAFTLRTSLGASHNRWSGALYSPGDDELIAAREYTVAPIVDRVGAGDAFGAGLIYGFRKLGEEAAGRREALEFAAAASCLKHTIPGDFNLVTVEEVESLRKGGGSGRISR